MQIQYVCDTPFFLKSQKGKYPVKKRYFTLVELLVVVGIVVILAGLVLPAVIGGAQQGRITQAKSDMKAIQMALAQMDQTYGRILKAESNGKIKFANVTGDGLAPISDSYTKNSTTYDTKYIVLGKKDETGVKFSGGNYELEDKHEEAYNSFIAEITGTNNKGYQHNSRKIKFLDPNQNFDPSKDYDADDTQKACLWRDPWGNPYVIMISVDGNDRLVKPDAPSNGRFIMSKTALYSFGPNGENNQGKNAVEGGDKLDDDIATWHK